MVFTEYKTKEEILALAAQDPELTSWLSENTIPQADWEQPTQIREARAQRAGASFEALNKPGQTIQIPMRDGYKSEIRIYRPEGSISKSETPLIVLNYGGAFISGDNRHLAAVGLTLVELYNATVVLPNYRLAPENPFPVAQNDIWDTLLWLSSHESEVGSDGAAGFVIGGVSAGGNLSAALGQKWVDEAQTPKLTGLWLDIPLVFHSIDDVPEEYKDSYLSREQNSDALVINRAAMEHIGKHQNPDARSPLSSPFNSPNPERHLNLKDVRVYFQVAGADPLRDDALIYERVLRSVGVQTRLDMYQGAPHGHASFFPFLTAAKKHNVDAAKQFAWVLRKDEPAHAQVEKAVGSPFGS